MIFRYPKDRELTTVELDKFIGKHRAQVVKDFQPLHDAYVGDHEIMHLPKKATYKPDNRIVINFPKYIVDTMNGFFIGNPIKTTAEDAEVSDFVEYIEQYNDQDDNNAELSKICDIYGRGYEMYYTDENAELCITYLSPLEAFMIYDESIVERPLYFVRRYVDWEGNEFGSISDSVGVRNFQITGGLKWLDEWQPHHFDGVPATEYVENGERLGIFETVMSSVNAYNKAISSKMNDVDYFADAYMKILGMELDEEGMRHIRDNRIINMYGEDAGKLIVEFMQKPDGDTTQENLLNRLERLIFHVSMVADVSDEAFGSASGIALKYKILAMHNLAKTKERKFTSGMNRRYKLLFSHPVSKVPADAWVQLHYQFTPNIPANMLEEAQIAAQMEGITSHETQLKVLSVVDNVQDELDKIEEENKAPERTIVDRMMFPNEPTETTDPLEEVMDDENNAEATEVQGKTLNGAQTKRLIAIMAQYTAGQLTEGQAINLIATAIGISKSEAKKILSGDLNE